jgi:hypothetical protein
MKRFLKGFKRLFPYFADTTEREGIRGERRPTKDRVKTG